MMDATITTADYVRNISRNILGILAERRMSIYALAKNSGQPQNTVYRIVRGQNEPGTVVLSRIAAALDCTVDDLLKNPKKKEK